MAAAGSGVDNSPRYFGIDDSSQHAVRIVQVQQKDVSALDFLERLNNEAAIKVDVANKSLQDVVTTVVSGYERKYGAERCILCRIWDCILRLFGWTTDLDTLHALSTELQKVEAVEGDSSELALKTKLRPIVTFLTKLPHGAARAFFEAQWKIDSENPLALPDVNSAVHSDLQNLPKKLNRLRGKGLIDLAQAICWCARAYERAYTNHYAETDSDYLTPYKEISAQADPSLFQGIEKDDVSDVERDVNTICRERALTAVDAGDLRSAAQALFYTDYVDKKDELPRVLTMIDQCLAKGELRLAMHAVSRFWFKDKQKLLLRIAAAVIEKPAFAEGELEMATSILIAARGENLWDRLISKLIELKMLDAAVKAVNQRKAALFTTDENLWLKEIVRLHLAENNYRKALEVAPQLSLMGEYDRSSAFTSIFNSARDAGNWDVAFSAAQNILLGKNGFATRNAALEQIAVHFDAIDKAMAAQVRSKKR